MADKSRYTPGPALTVILVIALVALGYGAVYLLTSGAPYNNAFSSIAVMLVAIAIILGIAYAILKGIFHYAKLKDNSEKELKVEDLPQDADDAKLKD